MLVTCSHREFRIRGLWTAVTLCALLLFGCECSETAIDLSGPWGSCSNPVQGVVRGAHSHSIQELCEESAGVARSLALEGNIGHAHFVRLSAAQVDSIIAGETVNQYSDDLEGHDHPVTFN